MTVVVDTKTVTVQRVRRSMGVHKVTWKDPKKRSILLDVDRASLIADDLIAMAVQDCYPLDERPRVVVPAGAWR